MANITASMVKDLREKTGVGMMDCKTALTETNGDMEAADLGGVVARLKRDDHRGVAANLQRERADLGGGIA